MKNMDQLPRSPGNPARRIMKRLGNRPAQRHAVRVMFAVAPWRRAGLTLEECCDRLHAEDVPTFRGRPWTAARLSQVLKQGRVATFTVVDKGEWPSVRAAVYPRLHKEEP